MILIGQFDSPFVRRVAIAMRLYGIPFEHRPWSVFARCREDRAVQPADARADAGHGRWDEVLIESPPSSMRSTRWPATGKAMMPASGEDRRQALKVCALATGLNDKAVSMAYETADPQSRDAGLDRALPAARSPAC